MKIGFDYSAAALPERTGVGLYTDRLARALAFIDRDNQYLLYPFFYLLFNGDYKKVDYPSAENFKTAFKNIPFPHLFRYVWFAGIPMYIKERMLGNMDVVHSNSFCVPRFRSRKKRLVVTIYDLTVITHPECHTAGNVRHCAKGIKDAVKYADAIISISEHTKRDLITHMNAPEELITVTPLAAGSEFTEVTDQERLSAVRTKYNLPESFILFVGSLEPRKNVKSLLRAYADLPERLKKGFPLVVAGARGWKNSDIPVLLKELGLEKDAVFPGFIDGGDIGALYSLATVFVYPSLYEGFGLPILEAMKCGTPVITSNTSSMPEVAGDAAVLIDPHRINELSAALEKVLDDEVLRGGLRKQGLLRAESFSWERCARETLAVYRKVVESGRI